MVIVSWLSASAVQSTSSVKDDPYYRTARISPDDLGGVLVGPAAPAERRITLFERPFERDVRAVVVEGAADARGLSQAVVAK